MARQRNIKLIVQYDGTSFAGWARQPGKRTVQGELEGAVSRLTGEQIVLTASSRTDSGVHALGQTVNFKTRSGVPTKRFERALKRYLPDDISAFGAEEMSPGFNSRRSAKWKMYSYLISCGGSLPPHIRRVAWEVPGKLDLKAMQKAARMLCGRHDFTSFTSRDKRRRLKDPVRDLSLVRVKEAGVGELFAYLKGRSRARLIRMDFKGTGFLYKMVRGMAGTLYDVGRGRLPADSIADIISSLKRASAGRTAPAKGLTLLEVGF